MWKDSGKAQLIINRVNSLTLLFAWEIFMVWKYDYVKDKIGTIHLNAKHSFFVTCSCEFKEE